MCTTISGHTAVTGSGKHGNGWFRVDHAHLSYDHPFHAPLEHAVLLDLTDGSADPPARLAVELSLDSARRLAAALAETIRQAEAYEQALDAG
jgi:anti-sigma factor RsiW